MTFNHLDYHLIHKNWKCQNTLGQLRVKDDETWCTIMIMVADVMNWLYVHGLNDLINGEYMKHDCHGFAFAKSMKFSHAQPRVVSSTELIKRHASCTHSVIHPSWSIQNQSSLDPFKSCKWHFEKSMLMYTATFKPMLSTEQVVPRISASPTGSCIFDVVGAVGTSGRIAAFTASKVCDAPCGLFLCSADWFPAQSLNWPMNMCNVCTCVIKHG